ncbi:BH3-interacting domain death agonist [Plecturocebus cupreus]
MRLKAGAADLASACCDLLQDPPAPGVSNGSGLHDERITNLLVFGFLQSCSNHSFHRELEALGRELPEWEEPDEELQTDGNRGSHSHVGRIEAGVVVTHQLRWPYPWGHGAVCRSLGLNRGPKLRYCPEPSSALVPSPPAVGLVEQSTCSVGAGATLEGEGLALSSRRSVLSWGRVVWGRASGPLSESALSLPPLPEHADSESQEDVIRNIARHLAQVGDSMDRSIPPGLVNHLALQLRNAGRSEEDRRRDLGTALEQLLQAHPMDMDKEKTMLVLALLLAKEVANHTPSLLRDVFRTTVNFINQNLRAYVRSLARNVSTREVSPSLPAAHALFSGWSRSPAGPLPLMPVQGLQAFLLRFALAVSKKAV